MEVYNLPVYSTSTYEQGVDAHRNIVKRQAPPIGGAGQTVALSRLEGTPVAPGEKAPVGSVIVYKPSLHKTEEFLLGPGELYAVTRIDGGFQVVQALPNERILPPGAYKIKRVDVETIVQPFAIGFAPLNPPAAASTNSSALIASASATSVMASAGTVVLFPKIRRQIIKSRSLKALEDDMRRFADLKVMAAGTSDELIKRSINNTAEKLKIYDDLHEAVIKLLDEQASGQEIVEIEKQLQNAKKELINTTTEAEKLVRKKAAYARTYGKNLDKEARNYEVQLKNLQEEREFFEKQASTLEAHIKDYKAEIGVVTVQMSAQQSIAMIEDPSSPHSISADSDQSGITTPSTCTPFSIKGLSVRNRA